MKVEINEDQNTLTVDGVEYEAKLNNAKPHESCKSCAFLYGGFFCKIAMETPLGVNASDLRRCEYPYRNDGKSIFWVKKEQKMTEAKPHVHAELIKKWADNVNQDVWYFEIESEKWTKWGNDSVMWLSSHQYAIGEMPTEPPVKMVKYDNGSIEFPEPVRVELEKDKEYWGCFVHGSGPCSWTGHVDDFELLDKGLIQLTREGAQKQSEALDELLKNHAEKWGWN